MGTNLASSNNADEDYIDMEINSSSKFLCYSINSPPNAIEFEFQMSSASNERETTTSPAEELFYKGKILPLHLPPGLQMVQNLLQNPTTTKFQNTKHPFEDENYTITFITSSTTPNTSTNTSLESCNISPSESCRVSCELNPDEYFFEWSTELSRFVADNPKKPWSKKLKLKLIKQSLLAQKLRTSRAYLKTLFTKSACSDESSAKAASNVDSENDSKGKKCLNKYVKVAKKSPFGQIGKGTYPTIAAVMKSLDKEMAEDVVNSHRKSFSGAIKRRCVKTTSSSSSSSGSSSLSSSFS